MGFYVYRRRIFLCYNNPSWVSVSWGSKACGGSQQPHASSSMFMYLVVCLEKRVLWDERRGLRDSNLHSPWCVVGDFNIVRCLSERKGVTSKLGSRDMAELDEFIDNFGLNDLPLIGRKFTWHRSNGKCMSRIGRFLISDELLEEWKDLAQWGLERSVSDHCPIVLKTKFVDCGPKPFRVLNCWLQSKDFQNLFKEKWEALSVFGWVFFCGEGEAKIGKAGHQVME